MSTRDQAVLTAEATRAVFAGKFGADGTRSGSVDGHRSLVTVPARRRRKCSCGCGTRATHIGLGDGIALMSGCQLSVHRWVRDGYDQDDNQDGRDGADLRCGAGCAGGDHPGHRAGLGGILVGRPRPGDQR